MTNLSESPTVTRHAAAEAEVGVSQEILSAIVDGTVASGDVLSVAELAGVMAGKRAAELIPLVHSTLLSELLVVATPERATRTVRIRTETAAVAASGVEMEALTAAAVAALTLYDMIRAVDPGAEIRGVRLLPSVTSSDAAGRAAGESERAARPRAVRSAGRVTSGPGAGRSVAGRHVGRPQAPQRGK